MFQRRVVGLVLAGFAVTLMAFTLLSHRWWTYQEGDESAWFGLRSAELCDEDHDDGRTREECKTMSLGKMFRGEDEENEYNDYGDYGDYDDRPERKEPSGFIMLGNLAFFGGIGAGALLVICGGAVLMNAHTRASKNLGIATAIGSAVYAGAGLLYVLMAPDQLDNIPMGMALPLALIGGGCGLAAGMILANYDPGVEPRPIPVAHVLSGLAPSKVPSIVLSVIGVVLVAGAVFTNTWWGRSEDEYKFRIGVREAESCSPERSDYDYDSYESDRSSGRERCQTAILTTRERGGDYDDDDDGDGDSSMKTFVRAGAATYHLGIMACVLTLLASALMLAGQKLPGPFTPANVMIGLAGLFLLAAVVFLASKPSSMKELNASFGPVLALGGGGCLIGAGIAISRFLPPGMTVQPQAWGPPGMTPMMMPGHHMPMMPGHQMGMMPPAPMGVPLAPLAPLSPMTPVPGAIPAYTADVRSGPVTPACPQCAAPMTFAAQHGRWFCPSCRIYA